MPRRRQRFAALEKQLRENGGVATPGSRLAGFVDFKKGINKIEVSKILTAAERKRYGFALLPFGITPAATNPKRYAGAITDYSYKQLGTVGFTNANLGYEDIDAATDQSGNFYPALLRVFVKSGGAQTSPISGVTKKEYKRTPGSSYSFPFGRTISGVKDTGSAAAETTLNEADEEDVRKSLTAAVKIKLPTCSVSYEPEVFKTSRQSLASPV